MTLPTNHTELLNYLVERFGLHKYCEIGVQQPANNFDKIMAKEWKVAVDPAMTGKPNTGVAYNCTSDEYFLNRPAEADKFSLFFIDGLHHADQVKKDFENALASLSDDGFIVLHDCLPDDEQSSLVPRVTKRWFGDVYKFAMNIGQYAGIRYQTFDFDCGCMVVWKAPKTVSSPKRYNEDWQTYLSWKHESMNITTDFSCLGQR